MVIRSRQYDVTGLFRIAQYPGDKNMVFGNQQEEVGIVIVVVVVTS